jgi:hypothetical protein
MSNKNLCVCVCVTVWEWEREREIVIACLVIVLSIIVNECLACSANFSAIKNEWFSWLTRLCEILFQIRENVLGDFRNVKTSVWGRSTNPSEVQTFKRGPNISWGQWAFTTNYNIKKTKKISKKLESDSFQSSFDRSWCSRVSRNFKNQVSWDSH